MLPGSSRDGERCCENRSQTLLRLLVLVVDTASGAPPPLRRQERTPRLPVGVMLNKHIHEIRFPESCDKYYESLH